MEYSPSSEADSRSASQEIQAVRTLWIRRSVAVSWAVRVFLCGIPKYDGLFKGLWKSHSLQ